MHMDIVHRSRQIPGRAEANFMMISLDGGGGWVIWGASRWGGREVERRIGVDHQNGGRAAEESEAAARGTLYHDSPPPPPLPPPRAQCAPAHPP